MKIGHVVKNAVSDRLLRPFNDMARYVPSVDKTRAGRIMWRFSGSAASSVCSSERDVPPLSLASEPDEVKKTRLRSPGAKLRELGGKRNRWRVSSH